MIILIIYILFYIIILLFLHSYFYKTKIEPYINFDINDKYKTKYQPRKYDRSKYHSNAIKIKKPINNNNFDNIIEQEYKYDNVINVLSDKELEENELLNYMQPKISHRN